MLVASLVAVLLALPWSASAEHPHTKRKHQVITIDQIMVHPQTLTISSDEVVVWANYSSRRVQIKFPAEVAGKFTCALRPEFYKAGDGSILSRPIGALEFAMPCRLEPGGYSYRVLGTNTDLMADPEAEDPSDPRGKIIVQ